MALTFEISPVSIGLHLKCSTRPANQMFFGKLLSCILNMAIHVCIAALTCLSVCLTAAPQQYCSTLLTLAKLAGAPGRQSSMEPIMNFQLGDEKEICAITPENI